MDTSAQASLIIQTFQKHLDFFISTELLMLSALAALYFWLITERTRKACIKWRVSVPVIGGIVAALMLCWGLIVAWGAHQKLLVKTTAAYKGNYDEAIAYVAEQTNHLFVCERNLIIATFILTFVIGWFAVHFTEATK